MKSTSCSMAVKMSAFVVFAAFFSGASSASSSDCRAKPLPTFLNGKFPVNAKDQPLGQRAPAFAAQGECTAKHPRSLFDVDVFVLISFVMLDFSDTAAHA